jgi:hypothetical protein
MAKVEKKPRNRSCVSPRAVEVYATFVKDNLRSVEQKICAYSATHIFLWVGGHHIGMICFVHPYGFVARNNFKYFARNIFFKFENVSAILSAIVDTPQQLAS